MSDPSRPSRSELLRALAVLAEPPSAEHARLAELLELGPPLDAARYSDVFLFQLYPYASVHVGGEGMMGGEAAERVAGFWRALGRTPPAEPDHLAALVGLYAALIDDGGLRSESERAPTDRRPEGYEAESVLLSESAAALLHEHIAAWVFPFLARVEELATGAYGAWAGLLTRSLRDELERTAIEERGLPLHLKTAPPLPDPRRDGGGAFLAGLLAPVRSGVTLTRADLARIARDLGLGLRAGERRYALEHLLAQDAVPVLRALAAEAKRRGAEHEARIPWLGGIARFQAERAKATAELLDRLSVEGSGQADAAHADGAGDGLESIGPQASTAPFEATASTGS